MQCIDRVAVLIQGIDNFLSQWNRSITATFPRAAALPAVPMAEQTWSFVHFTEEVTAAEAQGRTDPETKLEKEVAEAKVVFSLVNRIREAAKLLKVRPADMMTMLWELTMSPTPTPSPAGRWQTREAWIHRGVDHSHFSHGIASQGLIRSREGFVREGFVREGFIRSSGTRRRKRRPWQGKGRQEFE